RYTRLPSESPFHAFTNAKSARSGDSSTYGLPSITRVSLPSATSVPYPVGVKNPPMPAPPARIRSANVPCGTSSTSSSPLRNCRSHSLFSPTYVETIFCTCRDRRSMPMPNSSTPALLLMTVRPFVPRACSALMRFSGMPHRPKPPIMIVAPSGTNATAASASGSTLFTIDDYTRLLFQGVPPAGRGREDLREPIAFRQVAAQILKHGDQRIERRSQLVGVGGGDVAPDLGRA